MAAKLYFAVRKINRQVTDDNNCVVGTEQFSEVNCQAKFLALKGDSKEVADAFGRTYLAANVEVDPGYDKFIQSCDPVVKGVLAMAKPGDVLRIRGVLKQNSGSYGYHTRATEVTIVEPAPIGPAAVTAKRSTTKRNVESIA